MRLSISNIAWDLSEDDSVARLLRHYRFDAIDLAPGKYFPVPQDATTSDILLVKSQWLNRGMEVIGLQALLFGTTGLNLFSEEAVQKAMLNHLDAICRIGAGLGACRVVFGSPKNRDRSQLSDIETADKASHFFYRLGEIAQGYGVKICLEPNPKHYGCNFMVNCTETANIVRNVGHPAILMQFDTGALTMNGESPEAVLVADAALIGHVHASEPDLVPLGDGSTDHGAMAKALLKFSPQQIVTIEMRASENEPHLVSIERALQVAIRHYRTPGET